jgi:hypothetical protein
MAKKEVPLQRLSDYLPEHTFEAVGIYLNEFKVHLTITKSRSSVLGDYRHKADTKHHRISINGDLNRYAFLITLLHELAHLLTYENFGRRVSAHGKEWKTIYGKLLAQFIEKKIFPQDIETELLRILHNPGASSCSEEGLQRILYRYDEKKNGHLLIEQIPEGAVFSIAGGRRFVKGAKRRKRHVCKEIGTGRSFLFSGIYEVVMEENG